MVLTGFCQPVKTSPVLTTATLLVCAPKTRRKLLLGMKLTVMVMIMSQAGGLKMEQIQDLVILAYY